MSCGPGCTSAADRRCPISYASKLEFQACIHTPAGSTTATRPSCSSSRDRAGVPRWRSSQPPMASCPPPEPLVAALPFRFVALLAPLPAASSAAARAAADFLFRVLLAASSVAACP